VFLKTPIEHPGIYEKRYIGPGKIVASKPYKQYEIEYKGKVYRRHEIHLKIWLGKFDSSSNYSLIHRLSIAICSTKP